MLLLGFTRKFVSIFTTTGTHTVSVMSLVARSLCWQYCQEWPLHNHLCCGCVVRYRLLRQRCASARPRAYCRYDSVFTTTRRQCVGGADAERRQCTRVLHVSRNATYWQSQCAVLTVYSISGNLKLDDIFPSLGNSELKVLSIISAFLLISLQLTTAASVKEKVLISSSSVLSLPLA